MTKYLIGIVVFLLIGGAAWWYLQPKENTPIETLPVTSAPGVKPWIEVVSTVATAVDAKGTNTTLATGDEVSIGSIITTDATGIVLVHFPDGSFVKLDPSSSITITNVSYDESNGATDVHIALGSGTLWSKVLDLVGVNSSWQVETSNAVATVRGTSFVIFVDKGKTKVVGIENKVAVTPLQPDTHKPLSIEADVTSDTQVTIDDTRIPALATGKEQMNVVAMSADISNSSSYKAFKEHEKKFDALRDSLREKHENDAEFRKEFRESQINDFQDKILERREKLIQSPDQTNIRLIDNIRVDSDIDITVDPVRTPPKTTVEKTEPQKSITPDRTVVPTIQNENVTSTVRPVSLTITSDRDLSRGMTENEIAIFHATLLLSDNSKKDVTDLVTWNVINNIGVFSTPGRFRAQLSQNDAESGRIPGAVFATFKKPDGKELNAVSTQFSIHVFVPSQTIIDG